MGKLRAARREDLRLYRGRFFASFSEQLNKKEGTVLRYKTVLLFTALILLMVLVLLLVRYLPAIKKYRQNSAYIKEQLQSAQSDRDYRYWKRKRACHYLRLLPFINRERAERLYAFFHRK